MYNSVGPVQVIGLRKDMIIGVKSMRVLGASERQDSIVEGF